MKKGRLIYSKTFTEKFTNDGNFHLTIPAKKREEMFAVLGKRPIGTDNFATVTVYFNSFEGESFEGNFRKTKRGGIRLYFNTDAQPFLRENAIKDVGYSVYSTDKKDILLITIGEEATSSTTPDYKKLNQRKQDYIEEALYDAEVQDESGEGGAKRKLTVGAGSSSEKVVRNPEIARDAIKKAHYKCEYDNTHTTFKKETGNQYMEAHHLIPCTKHNAEDYYKKFGVNIDCKENIVSLCPTCHRRIHYGSKEEKREIIKALYEKRKEALRKIGVEITLEELYELYK